MKLIHITITIGDKAVEHVFTKIDGHEESILRLIKEFVKNNPIE
jgi:hypothetical protein